MSLFEHHTPGFDELPWFDWYVKANLWEKGLGADEPVVGEFVEVMCCWALRRAKETGMLVYGEVIAVTDDTEDRRNSVPGRFRWSDYTVRIRGMHDGKFRSTAYLRKMSWLEVVAWEAYEPAPRSTTLIFLPLPPDFDPKAAEPPEPLPHPYYATIRIANL